jgi:hypothetical protein
VSIERAFPRGPRSERRSFDVPVVLIGGLLAGVLGLVFALVFGAWANRVQAQGDRGDAR